MAMRNDLRFSSGSYPRGGELLGYPCRNDGYGGHADGAARDRQAADAPVRRHLLALSWVVASTREVRKTTAAVTFTARFFLFVLTILAKHHLRRLWPDLGRTEDAASAAARANVPSSGRAGPDGRRSTARSYG